MAGVGALISTAAIISAAHIRANADALVRPAFPQSIGIETHWNDRWLLCEAGSQSEGRNANSQSRKLGGHAQIHQPNFTPLCFAHRGLRPCPSRGTPRP